MQSSWTNQDKLYMVLHLPDTRTSLPRFQDLSYGLQLREIAKYRLESIQKLAYYDFSYTMTLDFEVVVYKL